MFGSKIINIIYLLGFIFLTACSNTNNNIKPEDHSTAKNVVTARVNTQLGLRYLAKGNVALAKKKLLTALAQAPEIPDTWYSMGYFQEMTGNKDEAQNFYLKAIAVAKDKGESENNYGTFLCRNGEYKQAINHFMVALQDPNYLESSGAYQNAGLCALKIPDRALARKYFTEAVQQDPNSAIALLELAKLDYQQGNKTLARTRLKLYQLIAPATPDSSLLSKKLAVNDVTHPEVQAWS